MPACRECSREIGDATACWCAYCGAAITADAPTAASLPHARVAEPDLRWSGHGPLPDVRFAPGEIFASRYRIVSLLGRGAIGEVYRAEDLKLGQLVAIKLIAGKAARVDGHLQRFIAEVRLARAIAHPNVCRVYDIGEADGWHYLSMEFVDGETLQSLLRRIGPLPAPKALDIARQLCAGLAAAHDRRVLHRDLKPSNIMVDGRGQIRILDFGLAVASDEWTMGEIAGTPAYMAPEQLAGDRATERTDVYSVGLILYELYTGYRAFPVQSVEERQGVSADAPIARALEDLDPPIAAIISACLERAPADRPVSAAAVALLLPGGDPLAAAVAEGRMPSPEMIAVAGRKGILPPAVAWTALIAAIGGAIVVASQAYVLSVVPSDLPKPPDVLAERARDILTAAGADDTPTDSAFWFTPARARPPVGAALSPTAASANGAPTAATAPIDFVYRQSSQYLVPENFLHAVTADDPPAYFPGMASVTLDTRGRLIRFDRVPAQRARAPDAGPVPDWDRLFRDAGLDIREFVAVEPHDLPLVPHDRQLAWDRSAAPSTPLHVTAATFDGQPVYFDVGADDDETERSRNPLPAGRPGSAQAFVLAVVAALFALAAVLARQNLRRGQGDRRAARNVAVFTVCATVLSAILNAHHVPLSREELGFLIGVVGSALFYGALSWLIYISVEPFVRRVWPHTLISWTRLMSGRLLDPLVGRDLLAGVVAGVVLTGLTIIRVRVAHRGPPDIFLTSAVESLRSVRSFIGNGLTYQVLSAVINALGNFFVLFLVRVAVRKTWIAVGLLTFLAIAFGAGGTELRYDWALLWAIAAGLFTVTVLLRLGLLAYVAMLLAAGLLRGPITLDLNSWTFGMSLVSVLVVAMLAVVGFTLTLPGRSGLRPKPA